MTFLPSRWHYSPDKIMDCIAWWVCSVWTLCTSVSSAVSALLRRGCSSTCWGMWIPQKTKEKKFLSSTTCAWSYTWSGRLGIRQVTPKPTRSRFVKVKALVALTIFWICLPGRRGWPGSLMKEKQNVFLLLFHVLSAFSSLLKLNLNAYTLTFSQSCHSHPRSLSVSSP